MNEEVLRMAENETLNKVINIIREQLDLGDDRKIDEQTSIVDDLGADSLEIIELVMKMEEDFEIEIEEEESKSIKTVGDIVKAVDAKLNSK